MEFRKLDEMDGMALADNAEYFSKLYATFSAEHLRQRIRIIVAALGGGLRTREWVQTLPLAEIMMVNNQQGLRLCFNYGRKIPWESFAQILEIPGAAEYVAEYIISSNGTYTLERYSHEMKKQTGHDFRAYLLARTGAALHAVKDHMTKKALIRRYKLTKSDLASIGMPWPRSLK
jgi:hypothetical protein